jgi:hypothetical protein
VRERCRAGHTPAQAPLGASNARAKIETVPSHPCSGTIPPTRKTKNSCRPRRGWFGRLAIGPASLAAVGARRPEGSGPRTRTRANASATNHKPRSQAAFGLEPKTSSFTAERVEQVSTRWATDERSISSASSSGSVYCGTLLFRRAIECVDDSPGGLLVGAGNVELPQLAATEAQRQVGDHLALIELDGGQLAP